MCVWHRYSFCWCVEVRLPGSGPSPPVSYIQYHKHSAITKVVIPQSLGCSHFFLRLNRPSTNCLTKLGKWSLLQMTRHCSHPKNKQKEKKENKPTKTKSSKAWGKSPFVTSIDAYTQAHILTYIYIYIYFESICISELSHVPAKYDSPSQVPLSFVSCEVWWDCFSFSFFLFLYFCCIIFLLFYSKVEFHKKTNKQNIKKPFFSSCFVGCKFLLIKGDGQLDRRTDKQVSWLINTNYPCEKTSEEFSMLHCTHGQKWLQLFFLSIFSNT